jgi:cytochrome c5
MKSRTVLKLAVLFFGAVISLSSFALSDDARAAMEERLQPIAKVCMEGDDSCGAAAAPAAASGPQNPEDVYSASCSACHATGAAGAPKMGDTAAWAPRIAQGNDTLYKHAIGGFNGMPPKGLCMSCSDDDIKATVDYIVGKSQ